MGYEKLMQRLLSEVTKNWEVN